MDDFENFEVELSTQPHPPRDNPTNIIIIYFLCYGIVSWWKWLCAESDFEVGHPTGVRNSVIFLAGFVYTVFL